MYAINQDALNRTITRKKNAASKRINKVEISLMIINSFCSIFLFVDAFYDAHNWDFVGSALMLITVIYIFNSRQKRRKAENTFDRSMLGELDHAIANTNSIIRFTRMMIFGYLIPFSIFYVVKMIDLGASFEKWLLIFGMYSLAAFLIIWERRHCHEPRKNQLEKLKEKLEE